MVVLAVGFIAQGYGQSIWIGGGSDGHWSTPKNWANRVAPAPGPSTWIRLYDTDRTTMAVVDAHSPWVLNRLDLGRDGGPSPAVYDFVLSGNPLSFEGADPRIGTLTRGEQAVTNDLIVSQAGLSLYSYVGTFTLSGRISGTGLLRKSGDGLVVLSNPGNDHSNYTLSTSGRSSSAPHWLLAGAARPCSSLQRARWRRATRLIRRCWHG